MSTALGMIETSGWVALIQAADAMVKSAGSFLTRAHRKSPTGNNTN